MRRSFLAVSVLSLCVAQSIAAQIPGIAPGTKVRVTTRDSLQRRVLIVDDVRGDTIRFRHAGSQSSATTAQLTQLDVWRGKTRPAWAKWAPLWAPVAGAAVVGAWAYSAANDDDDTIITREDVGLAGAVLGAAIGAVASIGVVVGVKVDKWEPVPIGGSSAHPAVERSVFVAPSSRGVRLGFRAGF
jgi:hypothetical protein